jgi:hypothetical protein
MFANVKPGVWKDIRAVPATPGDADDAYDDDPRDVIRAPNEQWHYDAWRHQKGPKSKEEEDDDPPKVFKVGRTFYVAPDHDGPATELPSYSAEGNVGMGQPLTGGAKAGQKPVQEGPAGSTRQPPLKDAYVSGVPVDPKGRTQVAKPIDEAAVNDAIAANPDKVIRSHNEAWHGDAYRADAGQGPVPKAYKVGELVVIAPDHPAQGGKRLDGGGAGGGGTGGAPTTAAPTGSPAPGSDLGSVLNPIEIPTDPKAKADLLKDPIKGPAAKRQIDAQNDRERAQFMAKAKKGLEEKRNESAVEAPIPKAMSTIAPAPINPELEGDIPHNQTVRADDDSAEIETETKSTKWGRQGANATRTETTESKKQSGSTTETKTDTKQWSMGAGGVGKESKQREETATPDATKVTEKSSKTNVNLKGLTLTNTDVTEQGKGTSADPADPDSAKRSRTTRQSSVNLGPGGAEANKSITHETAGGTKAEAKGSVKAGPDGLEATGTGSMTTKSGFNGHLSVSGKHNVVAGDPRKLENGTFAVDFTVVDEKGAEIGGGWSKPGGGGPSVSFTAGHSSANAEFATRVFKSEAEAKAFQLTAAFQVSHELDSIEKAKSVEGALAMKEGESAGSSQTDTNSLGGSVSLEGAEIGVAWSDAVTRGLTIKRMGGTRVQVTPSISEKKVLAASISAFGQFGNTKSQTEIDAFAITFEFDLAKEDAKEAFKRYAKSGFPPPVPPAAKWVNTTTGHQLQDDDVYSFAHVGKIGWGEKAWQQTVVDETGTHSTAGGGKSETVDLGWARHITRDKNRHYEAQITGHVENGKATDFTGQITVGGEDAEFTRDKFAEIFIDKNRSKQDVTTSGEWTLSADIDPKAFEKMAELNPDMKKAKTREEQLKIYSEMAKAGGAHMIRGQVGESGRKLAWNLELKGDPNFPGAAGRDALNAQLAKLRDQLKSKPSNAGAVAAEAKDAITALNKRLDAVKDTTKYTDLPDELRQEQVDLIKDHIAKFESVRHQAISAATQTVEKEDLTQTLNRASSGRGYDQPNKDDREVAQLRDKNKIHTVEISALEKEILGTAKIVSRMFGGGTSVRWGEGVKKEIYLEHNTNAKNALAMARNMDERLKASAQKVREIQDKWNAETDPKANLANLRALEAALMDQIKIMDVQLESLRDAAREAYIVTSDAAIGHDWNFYKIIKVDGAARALAISGLTDDDL